MCFFLNPSCWFWFRLRSSVRAVQRPAQIFPKAIENDELKTSANTVVIVSSHIFEYVAGKKYFTTAFSLVTSRIEMVLLKFHLLQSVASAIVAIFLFSGNDQVAFGYRAHQGKCKDYDNSLSRITGAELK